MPIERERRERSSVLFLAGCLALNVPLLALFDRPVLVFGIPLLYLYLFGLWLALIVLLALINRARPGPLPSNGHGEGDDE